MGISSRNPTVLYLTLLLHISYGFALFSEATNTITQGQFLRDGQTIVSSGQNFVLGFFSPPNSTFQYVGIWYNNISVQTIVWVANRDSPITDKNRVLTIGSNGNLMVLDGNDSSIWSSNASIVSKNTTAMLMDTGNLILSSNDSVGDTDKALWQSFGNPTDTFLPGMRVHTNASTVETQIFSSWMSVSNPSPGNFSMGIDPQGSPQIVLLQGPNRRWRSGHWNGLSFLGVPTTRTFYFNGFKFNNEGDGEMYFTYISSNSYQAVRFRVRWDGFIEQLAWNETTDVWGVLQLHPANKCEEYNKCGSFGKCSVMSSLVCNCFDGFGPKDSDQWSKGNWSGGCIRKKALQCGTNGSSDGFLAVEEVKLPDFASSVAAENVGECEEKCLTNCSCNAFAFVVGIRCMMWSGDLVDVEHFAEGGNTLYVRLDNSELGGKNRISTAAITTIVIAGSITLGLFFWLLWRFRTKLKGCSNSLCNDKIELPMLDASKSCELSTDFSRSDDLAAIEGKRGSGPELALFNFNCVAAATNNFANNHKLGQGGFGPVYKGVLPGGQEIAVKRLSRFSGQGLEEFKNEMILIAKLQHRNLVRLLGCCIEGEEKLLLYEYMPNKSLDSFLFDSAKQAQLDWSKRFAIIEGIARGLVYLHRDSRLRIIHRDLKASNILLDEEMKPKISDFGMARIFGGNQNEANTNRVVGTYGYMSPEYAMEGLFSMKSDVYSFGVLLLEIVSGRRNTSYRSPECLNLIRHAWNLWNDGKAMDLIDPRIVDSCSVNEVLRCIHVGILCVDDSAVHRPTMPAVVLMLESEGVTLPLPRQPTFSSMRSNVDNVLMDLGIEGDDTSSTNDLTDSGVVGR